MTNAKKDTPEILNLETVFYLPVHSAVVTRVDPFALIVLTVGTAFARATWKDHLALHVVLAHFRCKKRILKVVFNATVLV